MSTNLQQASNAFSARFNKGLSHEEQQLYTKIATVVQSTSSSTGYGFLDQVPKIREWLGSRVLHTLKDYEYEIKNKKFEATVRVPRTDFEDNDYGKYGLLFEDFGREADSFPNDYVFDLLKNGHQNKCIDGQNFFDTDHPVGHDDIQSVSNLYTTEEPNKVTEGWYLLDTSRVIQPLIWQERIKPNMTTLNKEENDNVFLYDEYLYGIRARGNAGYAFWQLASKSTAPLTEENFNVVYSGMGSLKGDNGSPLGVKPNLLIVSTAQRQAAHNIIKRQFLENGESNINFDAVEIMVCPYL